MADALADAGVDVAAWVPESRLDAIVTRLAARGVAVRTLTRARGRARGRPLLHHWRPAPRLADRVRGGGRGPPALAASSASTTAELREAVRVSARPGLVAVRIDEQLKPEPSPFVDPALVRVRFAERLERLG